MANPLQFKPPAVDPRTELNRRLDAAPTEHAEALLVAWDILQAAHDQGILDTVHGAISARDTIFGKLADYAKLPEGTVAIRNLLATVKLLGALNPETLDRLAKVLVTASSEERPNEPPPTLWQLFRRSTNEDSRRGLAFLTTLLSGLGRSLK